MFISFLTMYFMYGIFLKDNEKVWVFWLVLSICMLISGIIGFLLAKMEKIGVSVLGGVSGFFFALMILEMVQLKNEVAFWIIVSVSAVVLMIVAWFTSEYIKIFSTSMIGAYCIVRGVACYTGGFPNEFTTIEKLHDGAMAGIEWPFYVYLGCIIILGIAGSVI